MHTAVKVMLILGTLTTVGGIILMAVGASAIADYDPIEDAVWEGTSGTFVGDSNVDYWVYSKVSSCDEITYTINHANNGESAINQEYECDDSTQEMDGYISLGYLTTSYSEGDGSYTVESTHTVYLSDTMSELGDVAVGFGAVFASWGTICCGVFMLILGGIFALTITEPKMVVINQGGMPMQQGQMMAAQYPQPVQQQYAQQPVQQQYAQQPVQQQYTQQPVQQQPVQQQPVQQNPFGQPPVQQQPVQENPFDQQPPQGGF